jgi:hypothetical protein
MKKITSVSGGRTSAYIAANYPSDHLLFALVRIEDERCRFKDEVLRKRVEDKIQKPFIATAEDDAIIHTMFDLEQFLGKEITWVSGITYEDVIKTKGGWLPNKLHRFCTTFMKIKPMFEWWQKNLNEPVEMQIGFRANEVRRADNMLKKTDENGFLKFKAIIGHSKNGRNKWKEVPWQRPIFPLIDDSIYKDGITKFWEDKPVRFAAYNNCVGCFHRNPVFLRYMFQEHPEKMQWFSDQEGGEKGYWRDDNGVVTSYERIKKMLPQMRLYENDFTSCDSGYCEI